MGREIINKRFERLIVLQKDVLPHKYICKCDCGKVVSVADYNLYGKKQKSCGCLRLEKTIQRSTTHNQRHTKLYEVWKTMKQRCFNSNNKSFHNYGGRGIKVCNEWKDNYQAFYEWSMNNGYKEGLSIDRINNDGNYEPSNCRWTDKITQCNNTRQNKQFILNGVSKTIHQWSLEYNVPVSRVRQRVYCFNWDLEKALTTPPRYIKSSK